MICYVDMSALNAIASYITIEMVIAIRDGDWEDAARRRAPELRT